MGSERSKVPRDPALPREAADAPTRALTRRLVVLLAQIIDRINLLLDGFVPDLDALPTATASHRGRLLVIRGGTGVADRLYWCRKTSAESYEWKEIV